MADSPYAQMARLLSELQQRSERNDWDSAASLVEQINRFIAAGRMPQATPADRPHLEAALLSLQEIQEKAIPLRADMAKLLGAFDPASE